MLRTQIFRNQDTGFIKCLNKVIEIATTKDNALKNVELIRLFHSILHTKGDISVKESLKNLVPIDSLCIDIAKNGSNWGKNYLNLAFLVYFKDNPKPRDIVGYFKSYLKVLNVNEDVKEQDVRSVSGILKGFFDKVWSKIKSELQDHSHPKIDNLHKKILKLQGQAEDCVVSKDPNLVFPLVINNIIRHPVWYYMLQIWWSATRNLNTSVLESDKPDNFVDDFIDLIEFTLVKSKSKQDFYCDLNIKYVILDNLKLIQNINGLTNFEICSILKVLIKLMSMIINQKIDSWSDVFITCSKSLLFLTNGDSIFWKSMLTNSDILSVIGTCLSLSYNTEDEELNLKKLYSIVSPKKTKQWLNYENAPKTSNVIVTSLKHWASWILLELISCVASEAWCVKLIQSNIPSMLITLNIFTQYRLFKNLHQKVFLLSQLSLSYSDETPIFLADTSYNLYFYLQKLISNNSESSDEYSRLISSLPQKPHPYTTVNKNFVYEIIDLLSDIHSSLRFWWAPKVNNVSNTKVIKAFNNPEKISRAYMYLATHSAWVTILLNGQLIDYQFIKLPICKFRSHEQKQIYLKKILKPGTAKLKCRNLVDICDDLETEIGVDYYLRHHLPRPLRVFFKYGDLWKALLSPIVFWINLLLLLSYSKGNSGDGNQPKLYSLSIPGTKAFFHTLGAVWLALLIAIYTNTITTVGPLAVNRYYRRKALDPHK